MTHTMLRRSIMGFGTIALAMSTWGDAAVAVDFSFRGSFVQDDDIQLFDFSVGAFSDVTLRSYSYAGGVQADGTQIAAGGFDPILTLFDAAGNLIANNDDGPESAVPKDANTGYGFDVFLEAALNPGDYTVAITQYGNAARGNTLSAGFRRAGEGNFTTALCNTSVPFYDTGYSSCTPRTNAWAFDILNVSNAAVVDAVVDPAAAPVLDPVVNVLAVTPVAPTAAMVPTAAIAPSAAATNGETVPEPASATALGLMAALGYVTRKRRCPARSGCR
ncbi:MAG: DVUA0089 family protein [Cyanobacteria bacterium J06632_22]